MHRNRVWLAFGCCLAIVVGILLIVEAADIDNGLRIRTEQDLQTLLRTKVANGNDLATLVRQQFTAVSWKAYHSDERLSLTVVECSVRDREGQEALLSWEVAHNHSPVVGAKRHALLITALTRAAARLTPEFMPPGFTIERYPQDAYRLLGSTPLYVYAGH